MKNLGKISIRINRSHNTQVIFFIETIALVQVKP